MSEKPPITLEPGESRVLKQAGTTIRTKGAPGVTCGLDAKKPFSLGLITQFTRASGFKKVTLTNTLPVATSFDFEIA